MLGQLLISLSFSDPLLAIQYLVSHASSFECRTVNDEGEGVVMSQEAIQELEVV